MVEDRDITLLADEAVDLVASWLALAPEHETPASTKSMEQLEGVVTDPAGVAFVMQFVDRVVRPDDNGVAAGQLAAIVRERALPGFLSPLDRILLRAGARLGPILPGVVLPLARRRMRSIVGHLVAPAEPDRLGAHLAAARSEGYALNVNLLGEAVLGEREAQRRLDELLDLVEQPDVDYVSVKVSAVASQLNHFAHDDSLRRVSERLRILIDKASSVSPQTFVNFDMEEYHDLDLTMRAFMDVLSEEPRLHVDAGIVLQAYLPDVFPALLELVGWANDRHARGGGEVKIRLVKGANLAMERVDAAMHGWEQAPYMSKVEADANYKRCLDWLLAPENMSGVKLGLASHNLFDIAWAHLLATHRGVANRVQVEMLQGMAPALAATVKDDTHTKVLLYTPAVRDTDFVVAISYLFRRLEENAADDNFMRHVFGLTPGSDAFAEQERIFRDSLAMRNDVSTGPRRKQQRTEQTTPPYLPGESFQNEPDTDPTLLSNREWLAETMGRTPSAVVARPVDDVQGVDDALVRARGAQREWAGLDGLERQAVLHRVGLELMNRRSELISTMVHEAKKTFVEADVEVAEAIDFARWYGDRAIDLDGVDGATFAPLGVIAVVSPWNFPVAIPAGGVLASLAAGNGVLFKPAPETPRCAEIVAEACWAAGVSKDLLHFVRVPENEVGQHLITSVDGVILTGGSDTADLFRSWKPDLVLFAETSGKNALIVTPHADIDLAVADLVKSAFGHGGQKCSAASLGILVGDVYTSERFRRQLIDAVESIELGVSTDITTTMGPVVGEPNDRLARGLSTLDPGENWVVEPRLVTDDGGAQLWSPGVRAGVEVGSWFHATECFGPVLGLIHAADLDEAIRIQNASEFGLTGGIHTLDPGEVDHWTELVEVGNGYVNRPVTGAIVRRQPFGGWKRSAVGPGAKAGGPNYVAQLGTWSATGSDPTDDFEARWVDHFAIEHDPSALFCESNVFRYRPVPGMLARFNEGTGQRDRVLVRKAASVCGVPLLESEAETETEDELAARLADLPVVRMRVVGAPIGAELRRAANRARVHVADQPVLTAGRIELLHYVREQSISRTLHRFGNLVSVADEQLA